MYHSRCPDAVWRVLSVSEKKEAALSSGFKDVEGMLTMEHWGKEVEGDYVDHKI